jgi:hypothetical protein
MMDRGIPVLSYRFSVFPRYFQHFHLRIFG